MGDFRNLVYYHILYLLNSFFLTQATQFYFSVSQWYLDSDFVLFRYPPLGNMVNQPRLVPHIPVWHIPVSLCNRLLALYCLGDLLSYRSSRKWLNSFIRVLPSIFPVRFATRKWRTKPGRMGMAWESEYRFKGTTLVLGPPPPSPAGYLRFSFSQMKVQKN
jgi:hypothetical protein